VPAFLTPHPVIYTQGLCCINIQLGLFTALRIVSDKFIRCVSYKCFDWQWIFWSNSVFV